MDPSFSDPLSLPDIGRKLLPHTPFEALATTRTVRRRLDPERPVDMESILRALGYAGQAPTGGASIRAHFVVVTDPGTRAELGEHYRRVWNARYGEFLEAARSEAARRGEKAPSDLESAAHLAANMGRMPVHVVACVDTAGRSMDGNQASLWGSVLPAAWSYMLAVRSLGLASAWTTVLLDAEQEVAELLELPESVRIGAVLPTAYPLGEGFRPARRDNWAAHIHDERW